MTGPDSVNPKVTSVLAVSARPSFVWLAREVSYLGSTYSLSVCPIPLTVNVCKRLL
jgi:hypothetical protein